MLNIKLVKAWAVYKPGEWASVSDEVAKNLIAKGIAIDPSRPKPEPVAPLEAEPEAAKTAKRKAKRRK